VALEIKLMRWRRRDEGENPAWPGLVDVFAFTLVFVMMLWFGTDLQEKLAELRKENADLKQQLQGAREKIGLLEEKLAKLVGKGRKELQSLFEQLLPFVENNSFAVEQELNLLEIRIQAKPPISFGTARYELSEDDRQRLFQLGPLLYKVLGDQPFYILINGTADPREMRDSGVPPRDNIQLSALRAATVAALLEKAAPGFGKHLRIVGLGVKGQEVALKPGDDPEELYRPYRTVDLVVKVDVEKLLQQARPTAPDEGKP
jgi:flagellar motor protein MotB